MSLLLTALLTLATADAGFAIHLTSGETIEIDAQPVADGRRVIFKVKGRAYSLPADMIAEIGPIPGDDRGTNRAGEDAATHRLRVDRESVAQRFGALSRAETEAEAKARGETPPPAPPQNLPAPVTQPPPRHDVPDEREERYWRGRARALHEGVLQATETLELLTRRERRLNDEILGLLALGHPESHLGRQAWQLQNTRDAIEAAALEIKRARRALADFEEEARREGVYPGWIRY